MLDLVAISIIMIPIYIGWALVLIPLLIALMTPIFLLFYSIYLFMKWLFPKEPLKISDIILINLDDMKAHSFVNLAYENSLRTNWRRNRLAIAY